MRKEYAAKIVSEFENLVDVANFRNVLSSGVVFFTTELVEVIEWLRLIVEKEIPFAFLYKNGYYQIMVPSDYEQDVRYIILNYGIQSLLAKKDQKIE